MMQDAGNKIQTIPTPASLHAIRLLRRDIPLLLRTAQTLDRISFEKISSANFADLNRYSLTKSKKKIFSISNTKTRTLDRAAPAIVLHSASLFDDLRPFRRLEFEKPVLNAGSFLDAGKLDFCYVPGPVENRESSDTSGDIGP